LAPDSSTCAKAFFELALDRMRPPAISDHMTSSEAPGPRRARSAAFVSYVNNTASARLRRRSRDNPTNQGVAAPIAGRGATFIFFAEPCPETASRGREHLGLTRGRVHRAAAPRHATAGPGVSLWVETELRDRRAGPAARCGAVLRSEKCALHRGAPCWPPALCGYKASPPLLLDMRAGARLRPRGGAVQAPTGRWGAISKTNGIGLRWRDPGLPLAPRAGDVPIFHEYTNKARPQDAARVTRCPSTCGRVDPKVWVTGEKNAWMVGGPPR